MKGISFVAHCAAFDLIETITKGSYSQYRVLCNEKELGQVEIPSHVNPRFSVGESGKVAIYGGGANVYIFVDGNIFFFEEDEEVKGLWFIDDEIFLECDTLLVSRKLSDFSISEQYWHTEIITAGLFCESGLFAFQDLENGVFELNLSSFAVCPSDYPFQSR